MEGFSAKQLKQVVSKKEGLTLRGYFERYVKSLHNKEKRHHRLFNTAAIASKYKLLAKLDDILAQQQKSKSQKKIASVKLKY